MNQTREEFLQEGHRPQKSVQGHAKILSAIERGKPAHAKRAMEGHLRNIEREALRASRTS
ncbi:MAG: FCD domain-containing protein [bacterium]